MFNLDAHFFKLGLHILVTTAGTKGAINLTPDTTIYVTERGLNSLETHGSSSGMSYFVVR